VEDTMERAPSRELINALDAIAQILLRCFVVAVVVLVVIWGAVGVAGDLAFQIVTYSVDMVRSEFDTLMLYYVSFLKGLVTVFFLIPFLAIKLYLRGK
jgi:hypothetical protein